MLDYAQSSDYYVHNYVVYLLLLLLYCGASIGWPAVSHILNIIHLRSFLQLLQKS